MFMTYILLGKRQSDGIYNLNLTRIKKSRKMTIQALKSDKKSQSYSTFGNVNNMWILIFRISILCFVPKLLIQQNFEQKYQNPHIIYSFKSTIALRLFIRFQCLFRHFSVLLYSCQIEIINCVTLSSSTKNIVCHKHRPSSNILSENKDWLSK